MSLLWGKCCWPRLTHRVPQSFWVSPPLLGVTSNVATNGSSAGQADSLPTAARGCRCQWQRCSRPCFGVFFRPQNEVTLLRNEVAQLKQLLLAHKDCPVTALQKKTQGYLGEWWLRGGLAALRVAQSG